MRCRASAASCDERWSEALRRAPIVDLRKRVAGGWPGDGGSSGNGGWCEGLVGSLAACPLVAPRVMASSRHSSPSQAPLSRPTSQSNAKRSNLVSEKSSRHSCTAIYSSSAGDGDRPRLHQRRRALRRKLFEKVDLVDAIDFIKNLSKSELSSRFFGCLKYSALFE